MKYASITAIIALAALLCLQQPTAHAGYSFVQADRITTATGGNWYGQLGRGSYDAGTSTMSVVIPTWP